MLSIVWPVGPVGHAIRRARKLEQLRRSQNALDYIGSTSQPLFHVRGEVQAASDDPREHEHGRQRVHAVTVHYASKLSAMELAYTWSLLPGIRPGL